MNIEIRFIEKAINDKNFINFYFDKKLLSNIQPLKFQDNKLHTNKGVFDFSKISKLTILKNKF